MQRILGLKGEAGEVTCWSVRIAGVSSAEGHRDDDEGRAAVTLCVPIPSYPEAQARQIGKIEGENQALGTAEVDCQRIAAAEVIKDGLDGEAAMGRPGFGEAGGRSFLGKKGLDAASFGTTVKGTGQRVGGAPGEASADPGADRAGEVWHAEEIGAVASSRASVRRWISYASILSEPTNRRRCRRFLPVVRAVATRAEAESR